MNKEGGVMPGIGLGRKCWEICIQLWEQQVLGYGGVDGAGVEGVTEVGGGKLWRTDRLRNPEVSCSQELWFVFIPAYFRDNPCCFCSQQRAPGKVLLDAVCNHLNLVEGDYFGLEFPDHKKITVGDVNLMLLFYHLFILVGGWAGVVK